jgi:Zn-dependent protease
MSEIRDITIATIVLSMVFTKFTLYYFGNLLHAFLASLFIVSLCFVLHELGHRSVARLYGCYAKFVMWPFGLLLALISLPLPFIFAAPGAVYISPYSKKFAFVVRPLTRKEYGLIGLAGPAANISVGIFMIFLTVLFPQFARIFLLTANLSFWFAFFNLIPFPPLDGEKIFRWSAKIWLVIMLIALIGWRIV